MEPNTQSNAVSTLPHLGQLSVAQRLDLPLDSDDDTDEDELVDDVAGRVYFTLDKENFNDKSQMVSKRWSEAINTLCKHTDTAALMSNTVFILYYNDLVNDFFVGRTQRKKDKHNASTLAAHAAGIWTELPLQLNFVVQEEKKKIMRNCISKSDVYWEHCDHLVPKIEYNRQISGIYLLTKASPTKMKKVKVFDTSFKSIKIDDKTDDGFNDGCFIHKVTFNKAIDGPYDESQLNEFYSRLRGDYNFAFRYKKI